MIAEANTGYRGENIGSTLLHMFSLLAIAAPIAVVGVFDALASRYGADSRPADGGRQL